MPKTKEKTLIDAAELPEHRKIHGITVDCFDIPLKNCSHYFLSHFHSDHYTKLSKSFEHPVYCSRTTAELVSLRIGAKAIGLEMYKTYDMETFYVRLIEANHCPGAVLFIFLIDSQYYLHTGDFRYHQKYHSFKDITFRTVYLDNTYENFQHFPSQKEAISKILTVFDQRGKLCPLNICVLCCSYLVGKEKIFLSIGEYLNKQIQVTEDKMAIYRCYDKYAVKKLNEDVVEIVSEKISEDTSLGFQKSLRLNVQITSIQKKAMARKGAVCTDTPNVVTDFTNANIKILETITDPLLSKHSRSATNTTPDYIRNKAMDSIKNITTEAEPENKLNTNIRIEDSEISSLSEYSTIEPFERLTTEEAPIKVIDFSQLQSFDTSKIFADKIYLIVGTGWREKHEFKNYKRMDGKTIKNGLEIIHFRYSEHSSASELADFQNSNFIKEVLNTVNNKSVA